MTRVAISTTDQRMKPKDMELTVVIVNYRVKYLLEQTLRSVEQAMQAHEVF